MARAPSLQQVRVGPRNEVGVSSRRTMILIAAVVVGAISAFLVFNYVNSADDRARANAREVDILKVANGHPEGTERSRGPVQENRSSHAKIPAEFKPQTAITDESIIADKVAVANYATGQILVDGMFADPIDNQITFAGRVSDGLWCDRSGRRTSRRSASRSPSRSTRCTASPASSCPATS